MDLCWISMSLFSLHVDLQGLDKMTAIMLTSHVMIQTVVTMLAGYVRPDQHYYDYNHGLPARKWHRA